MEPRSLADRIHDLKNNKKYRRRWSFTLEAGRGTTYSHPEPVLYGHNYFPDGCMKGRPLRQWIESWDSWDEARQALAQIPNFKYDDCGEQGGSTHIPIDILTAGLPDDEG